MVAFVFELELGLGLGSGVRLELELEIKSIWHVFCQSTRTKYRSHPTAAAVVLKTTPTREGGVSTPNYRCHVIMILFYSRLNDLIHCS